MTLKDLSAWLHEKLKNPANPAFDEQDANDRHIDRDADNDKAVAKHFGETGSYQGSPRTKRDESS